MDLLHPGWATRWRTHPPRTDRRWRRYAEPWRFYELARRPVPALLGSALLLLAVAVWAMWSPGPADAASGGAGHLLALHLALAWLSVALAGGLLATAVAGRLGAGPLPSLLIEAMAPSAALMALLAVLTGALWQQAGGGLLPPWEMPVPAAAWPLAGAALAQCLAAVLLRVRLVIVERARQGLQEGR